MADSIDSNPDIPVTSLAHQPLDQLMRSYAKEYGALIAISCAPSIDNIICGLKCNQTPLFATLPLFPQ
jgi:hypothetical protein